MLAVYDRFQHLSKILANEGRRLAAHRSGRATAQILIAAKRLLKFDGVGVPDITRRMRGPQTKSVYISPK